MHPLTALQEITNHLQQDLDRHRGFVKEQTRMRSEAASAGEILPEQAPVHGAPPQKLSEQELWDRFENALRETIETLQRHHNEIRAELF